MVVSGAVSAAVGFNVGRGALKGITQPDTRPVNGVTDPQGKALRRENLTFLKEKDILEAVKARIDGGEAAGDKPEKAATKDADVVEKEKKAAAEKAAAKPAASPTASPTTSPTSSPDGFPIRSESRSVSLEVVTVKQEEQTVILNLQLKNAGAEPVQFLYSALTVTNDQGRLLSADVQGLPEEVPANGQAYNGTVSIPKDLLDDTKSLSISLTDYPEQQVQLQVGSVPIVPIQP
jgi:hypothetical protein